MHPKKKKAPAKKKPIKLPATVWIVVNKNVPGRTVIPAAATSKRQAKDLLEDDGEIVAGPYVLLERKGH